MDILLVVNMFLTGFDSKPLNTIYVDKNLKYHGLLQAFSRTNRIYGSKKSQGNVVCFRNLKPATDKAIELFANKDAVEDIVLAPFENYLEKFNEAYEQLSKIAPTIDSVNELETEEDEAEFIKAFRNLLRLKNMMECFTDFDLKRLPIDEQTFADYKSKYLDLYDKVRSEGEKEKVSILDDLDFELELMKRDKINVSYIIGLLRNVQGGTEEEKAKQIKLINDLLDSETQLRSKRDLIDEFIAGQFNDLAPDADVSIAFDNYWAEKKKLTQNKISEEEHLDPAGLEKILGDYLFTQKPPMSDDIIKIINPEHKPKLKERKPVALRIIDKIKSFVETFLDAVD